MKKRSGVELRRKFNSRRMLAMAYVLVAAIYLVVGLQPANAEGYEIASQISIPEIGLESDVAAVELAGKDLSTPELIVGSFAGAKNKTLLLGHSTTVFRELWKLRRGDEIIYDGRKYEVAKIEFLRKGQVRMSRILKDEAKETLVLMTCAGELLDGGDATHRLVLTATIKD